MQRLQSMGRPPRGLISCAGLRSECGVWGAPYREGSQLGSLVLVMLGMSSVLSCRIRALSNCHVSLGSAMMVSPARQGTCKTPHNSRSRQLWLVSPRQRSARRSDQAAMTEVDQLEDGVPRSRSMPATKRQRSYRTLVVELRVDIWGDLKVGHLDSSAKIRLQLPQRFAAG